MRIRLSRFCSTAARRRLAAPSSWAIICCLALTPVLGLQAAGHLTAEPWSVWAAGAPTARAESVRLESIAGKVDRQTVAVLIQASEPVPYVVEQPDPLTVLVDLRHVSIAGTANKFTVADQDAIAAVTVEDMKAFDGATVARVKVRLARPAEPRVRSQRNVIRVEIDRNASLAAAAPTPMGAPPPLQPASPLNAARPSEPVAVPLSALAGPSPAPQAPATEQAGAQAPAQAPAPPPAQQSLQANAPAQQVTSQQAQQLGAKPAPKQYSGAPISLDFAGADIRSVLRLFVEFSGLNIFIDPKVQGTVDIQVKEVPWDQVLDFILKTNNLDYVVSGNIVRIAPVSVLAEEEAARRKLADEQAMGGDLDTITRTLSYAVADDVKSVILRSGASKRGNVEVDKRTNTLIVRDLPAAMPVITQIIDSLDKPQPQVEIEARIVQTNRNFLRQLGVQWGVSGKVDPALGNTTPLAFPNNGSISGRTGGTGGTDKTQSMVNLGTTSPASSAVGLSLGAVNGAFNLDVALSALETTGQGRLLSTPRVLAQNNFPAEMTQGVQIPIQTVANNTVTVTFKDAALKLVCTPQITANNTVIMNVELENATPDYTKQINNIPPINTQRAKTQVLVKDNETIVIGGIYVSSEQAQNDRTPALYRVPLLGWLFKRDILQDETKELLIFITPRILK